MICFWYDVQWQLHYQGKTRVHMMLVKQLKRHFHQFLQNSELWLCCAIATYWQLKWGSCNQEHTQDFHIIHTSAMSDSFSRWWYFTGNFLTKTKYLLTQAKDSPVRKYPLLQQFEGIQEIPLGTLSQISRTLQRSKTKIPRKTMTSGKDRVQDKQQDQD